MGRSTRACAPLDRTRPPHTPIFEPLPTTLQEASLGFELAGVDGRAGLVESGHLFDLENAATGELGTDRMTAIGATFAMKIDRISDEPGNARVSDVPI